MSLLKRKSNGKERDSRVKRECPVDETGMGIGIVPPPGEAV